MRWKSLLTLGGLFFNQGESQAVVPNNTVGNYSTLFDKNHLPDFQGTLAWEQREILEKFRVEFFEGDRSPSKENGFLLQKLAKYKQAIHNNSSELFLPEVELTYLEPYYRGSLISYVQKYGISKKLADIDQAIKYGEEALAIYTRRDEVDGNYHPADFGYQVDKAPGDELKITAPVDVGHRFSVLEQLTLASYLKFQHSFKSQKTHPAEDFARVENYSMMLRDFVKHNPEAEEKFNKSPIDGILSTVEKHNNTLWTGRAKQPSTTISMEL